MEQQCLKYVFNLTSALFYYDDTNLFSYMIYSDALCNPSNVFPFNMINFGEAGFKNSQKYIQEGIEDFVFSCS